MKSYCIVYKTRYKILVRAKNEEIVKRAAPQLIFEWLGEARTSEIYIRGAYVNSDYGQQLPGYYVVNRGVVSA